MEKPTDISLRMELIQASDEKGLTMPLVPMMLMPSTTPMRGLNVRLPVSRPSGTLMVTVADMPFGSNGSTLWRIIRCGTSFIAALPMGRPRPGRVTLPTPSPPVMLSDEG